MILRFFHQDKFASLFGSNPLDYFEEMTNHSKYNPLVSVKKVLNLCFKLKLLLPDEINYKIKEVQNEVEQGKLTTGFSQEVLRNKVDLIKIFEKKDALGLEITLLNNWEQKILKFLENPEELKGNLKVFWKVLTSEVRKMNLE
jgi:hypothetical protein